MSITNEINFSRGDKLVVASHNPGKIREIQTLLDPFGLHVLSTGEMGAPEPEETGDTFEANARLKARASAEFTGLPALADDSGFCVAALNGAPGIYSARWAGPDKNFDIAMSRLNEEMGSATDRTAWFVCCLSVAWPTGKVLTFRGEVWGDAVWPPRGDKGFGYDPMFQPTGHAITFAEMEPKTKHGISHRAQAFRLFVDACLRS
jgi:XTP/dITP diphosphohydrolase